MIYLAGFFQEATGTHASFYEAQIQMLRGF